MRQRYSQVRCADGFTMSVQAGEHSYCSPRVDLGFVFNDGRVADKYNSVEVGYPSEAEPLLMRWVENADDPTETVYGFVPTSVVGLVLAKHGGMVEGTIPPGIPELRPTGWEGEEDGA